MSTKISLPDLKNLCKENNIKGYSKLKKDEIINLLKTNKVEIKPLSIRCETEKITEDLEKLTVKDNKKKKSENDTVINDKFDKPIIKYYTFKDEKSDKFWEITYEDSKDEKVKYLVRYGKKDTPGSRSIPKMDKMSNINKLMSTKTEKGYILKK